MRSSSATPTNAWLWRRNSSGRPRNVWLRMRARCCWRRGALYRLGQLEEEMARCQATIELAERFGPSVELARAHNLLGHLYLDRGDPERAIATHRAALAVAQEIGDPQHEILSRLNLAI